MCKTKTGGNPDDGKYKPWGVPVDPHEKVASVEQDNWLVLFDQLYAGLLKHAMNPENRLEEITTLLTMVTEAKNLHISLLCFDQETENYRAKVSD